MIGIIIGAVAVVSLVVLLKKDAKKRNEEFEAFELGMAVFLGVMLTVILDLCAWGIFAGVAIETTKTPEIVASEKIVALQDNSSVSGSFFLGSGSVDNKNYYAFYYETENGFKYMTLDAESTRNPVYIKYITSNTETPHIDQYAVVERKSLNTDANPIWFSLIAFFQYGKYDAGEIFSKEISGPAILLNSDEPNYYDKFRYEIHIPEGSIKTGYAIDLE